jgi:hypothetical protein
MLNFKEGHITGVATIYFKNNQPEYQVKKINEKNFIKHQFYENGALCCKSIINSVGKVKNKEKYNENGQLIYFEKLNKKIIVLKEWFDNGQLKKHAYTTPNIYFKNHRTFSIFTKSTEYSIDGGLESYIFISRKNNRCGCGCPPSFILCECRDVKLGLQKQINSKSSFCYIIKNHKNVFNLISNHGRFNFTSPYLKNTWRIRPKIIIK